MDNYINENITKCKVSLSITSEAICVSILCTVLVVVEFSSFIVISSNGAIPPDTRVQPENWIGDHSLPSRQ